MTVESTPRKQQVREDWSSRGPFWDRWSDVVAETGDMLNRPLLELARIGLGQRVLDLASGAGEPALTIAEAVGPAGSVVATDLVVEMMTGAERRAKALGRHNIRFEVADMEALSYPDASFDRVTCRFGIMFCENTSKALSEARRVLKPGGWAGFMVWGKLEANVLQLAVTHAIERVLGFHPWTADLNPFRYAAPGSVKPLMKAAGFVSASEHDLKVAPRPPADGRKFWLPMLDMGMGPYLAKATDSQRADLDKVMVDELARYREGENYALPSLLRIIIGQRPA